MQPNARADLERSSGKFFACIWRPKAQQTGKVNSHHMAPLDANIDRCWDVLARKSAQRSVPVLRASKQPPPVGGPGLSMKSSPLACATHDGVERGVCLAPGRRLGLVSARGEHDQGKGRGEAKAPLVFSSGGGRKSMIQRRSSKCGHMPATTAKPYRSVPVQ